MKKRIVTPLTREVGSDLNGFKYQKGRFVALALTLVLFGGGVALLFLDGWLRIAGVAFVVVTLFLVASFTVFWPRLLQRLSAEDLARNPFPEGVRLLYLFEDEQWSVTLEKVGASNVSETHPYSYFNRIDVGEKYCFLNYGNPKENPAFPVLFDPELLAFLSQKGIPFKDHRKKKA